MMEYSVLMTVYKKDSATFLKQSIISMLNQTVKTNDFVLVCDGEISDELEKAIDEVFEGNRDILNLIRLPQNVGLGKALCIGLPKCKNNWVARMDDDDISHLDRCEIQLDYIETHPGLSIIGSYVNEFEVDPKTSIRIKKLPTGQDEILKFSKRRNPFNHSTVMINKKDILEAGGYSQMRTNQDVDTWVRALNQGFKGANLPLPLVDFRFDKKTYARRKEWKNVKLMIEVWHSFWKKGYCSFSDYVYVIIVQMGVFILPKRAVQWAYDNFR